MGTRQRLHSTKAPWQAGGQQSGQGERFRRGTHLCVDWYCSLTKSTVLESTIYTVLLMQIFGFYFGEVGFVKFIVKHVVLSKDRLKFVDRRNSWTHLSAEQVRVAHLYQIQPSFSLFVDFSGCLFVNLICPSIYLSIQSDGAGEQRESSHEHLDFADRSHSRIVPSCVTGMCRRPMKMWKWRS